MRGLARQLWKVSQVGSPAEDGSHSQYELAAADTRPAAHLTIHLSDYDGGKWSDEFH